MICKLYSVLALIVLSATDQCLAVFSVPKNIFSAVADNNGIFDYGFTFTYVGVEPLEFEYFLFIHKHFWKIRKTEEDERQVCIEDLESHQHKEFDVPFTFAVSYLSDHMVKHDHELNLTNHVLLHFPLKSSVYMPEFEYHEMIENIFDANHPDLNWLVGGNYFPFPIPHFNASVGFQPQSFTDEEYTDGPNFVLLQQNMTDRGYVRRSEVHSLIDEKKIINSTDKYDKYIPAFIEELDPQLYINVIFPTRLGPGGVEEGTPAVILLFPHEGVIKYCVTEETAVDETCKPENLRQLLRCPFLRDEL